MNIETLAKQYAKHYGFLYETKGVEGHVEILMPYLMMDCGYQYLKNVTKYKKKGLIKHKAAQKLGRWRKAYETFFDTLYVAYPSDSDERQEVIDLMDRMESYIEHDLFIASICSSNCFMSYTGEMEEVLTSALMANMFSQMVYTLFKSMYATATFSRASWAKLQNITRAIGAVLQNSKDFSELMMGDTGEGEVTERKVMELKRSQSAIINKIRLWIKDEAQNEN